MRRYHWYARGPRIIGLAGPSPRLVSYRLFVDMSTCATVSMAGLASASVRASPATVLQPLCQPLRLVQTVSAGFGCDVTQIARSGAAITIRKITRRMRRPNRTGSPRRRRSGEALTATHAPPSHVTLLGPMPASMVRSNKFRRHRRFPNLTASVRPPYVRSAPSRRPAPCADRATGRGANRLAADLASSTRPELGPVVAQTRSSIASGRTAFQIASSHRLLYAFSADHDRGGFRAILLHNDEDLAQRLADRPAPCQRRRPPRSSGW